MAHRYPEIQDFENRIRELVTHHILKKHLIKDEIHLSKLTLEEVYELSRTEESRYLLLAAGRLNRTSLKEGTKSASAQIVTKNLREAYALKEHLPVRESFRSLAERAVALRTVDLARKHHGTVEALLRERLKAENIPILMSPPIRQVPGLLVERRKPDGVYPDPASGRAPKVYLEVKNVRRVADDIQKRLYEIAEASLEMKAIYGDLHLQGLDLQTTTEVHSHPQHRAVLRNQILSATPVVVAFLICPLAKAERYRDGAETFIDKVFFQEEMEQCLAFLRDTVGRFEAMGERGPALQ